MESRAERTPIVVAAQFDRLLDHLEDPAMALRITRFSSTHGVRAESIDADLLRQWLSEYILSELRAREILEAPAEEGEPGK